MYAASEVPIEGVSGEALSKSVSHDCVEYVATIEDSPGLLAPSLKPGDLLVCLGAGSVGSMPEKFLEAMSAGDAAPSLAQGA